MGTWQDAWMVPYAGRKMFAPYRSRHRIPTRSVICSSASAASMQIQYIIHTKRRKDCSDICRQDIVLWMLSIILGCISLLEEYVAYCHALVLEVAATIIMALVEE